MPRVIADIARIAPVGEAVDYSSLEGNELGSFRLRFVYPDGSVTVGCHSFDGAEVHRMAGYLHIPSCTFLQELYLSQEARIDSAIANVELLLNAWALDNPEPAVMSFEACLASLQPIERVEPELGYEHHSVDAGFNPEVSNLGV